jgi:hypothetical protein
MASVQKAYTMERQERVLQWSIIPISNIRQCCMLVPDFDELPPGAGQSWTSSNVLDKADSFLINNWQSMYSYRTLYM